MRARLHRPVLVAAVFSAAVGACPHVEAQAPIVYDITMTARVATSCRLHDVAHKITLSGRTDDGVWVHFSLAGTGAFSITCNTPYALSLARIGAPLAPAPLQDSVSQATDGDAAAPPAPGASPIVTGSTSAALPGDLDVGIELAGAPPVSAMSCRLASGSNSMCLVEPVSPRPGRAARPTVGRLSVRATAPVSDARLSLLITARI